MSYEMGILVVVFLTLAAVAAVSIFPAYYSWRWRRTWSRTGVRRPKWAEKLAKVARDFFATMAEAERLRAQADPYGLGLIACPVQLITKEGDRGAEASAELHSVRSARRQPSRDDGWRDYDEDGSAEWDFVVDLFIIVVAIPSALASAITCGGLKLWPARMEESVWELVACGSLVGVFSFAHWVTLGPNWASVTCTMVPACWLAYGLAYWLGYWLGRVRLPSADFM